MSALTRWLDRRLYPTHDDNWDDEALRKQILKYLRAGHVVLDLGAGAGIVRQMNFKGVAARVYGIDPDPRILENPNLDHAEVATAEAIPHAGDTFDMVFCDNVLEHLRDPDSVFREVARVLKPGGVFIVKTPNRAHYIALVARVTPHGFHQWYNRLRGRNSPDTFPTLYRANTEQRVRTLAEKAGFSVTELSFLDGRPEYLRISAAFYIVGWLYERLVTAHISRLRPVLLVTFRKD